MIDRYDEVLQKVHWACCQCFRHSHLGSSINTSMGDESPCRSCRQLRRARHIFRVDSGMGLPEPRTTLCASPLLLLLLGAEIGHCAHTATEKLTPHYVDRGHRAVGAEKYSISSGGWVNKRAKWKKQVS